MRRQLHALHALPLMLLALPLLIGCENDARLPMVTILGDAARDSVGAYLSHAGNYRLRLGWEMVPKEDEVPLGMIREARVRDDRIVIADYAPPVVRVFDTSGHQLWVAAPEGDGPGEAKRPRDLAVSDQGDVLLLHDAGRLTLFDESGRFVHTLRLPDPQPPIAVGTGCDGEWLLYGPTETGSGRHVPWLRALRIRGDSTALDTLWSGPSPRLAPPYADRQRLIRVGRVIRFDHPYGEVGGLLGWNCATEAIERVGETTFRSARPDVRELGDVEGRRVVGVGFRIDIPHSSGRVALGKGTLRTFELPWDRTVSMAATFLRFSVADTTYQVKVYGRYRVLDAWPDGRLLFGRSTALTNEVFTIDGRHLLDLLRDGAAVDSRSARDDTLFFWRATASSHSER